ncbi:hypothetical protein ACO1O0_008210 [Amphichorda felina]
MSQPPSTPVKVPSSAASYTPATLDPDLRSQINTLLLRDGHVTKIQDALLHSLNAHPSNWPTAIRSRALSLLRSGEVSSYPELLRRVLDDVRSGTEASPGATITAKGNTTTTTNGDSKKVNGGGAAAAGANGTSGDKMSLAVPQSVIDEALQVTRESLEAVCEVDENGTI